MTRIPTLLAVLAFAAVGAAKADEPDPIETRQAAQDLLSGDFAGIRAVVAAKGDVKTLEGPAKAMARWMRQFPIHFPKGTEQGHNTKALPRSGRTCRAFRTAASELADAADRLAQLAKAGDANGVAAQVKVVADACVACHHTYRAR